MTSEERLDRIEHITATLAEERKKDREEYKSLWRDTQRQIHENTVAIADLRDRIQDMGDQLGQRIDQLGQRLDQHAADSRAADERLGERIAALVSAIGEHVRLGH